MKQEAEILLRVVVAIVLTGILGWEREVVGKAAGLRTHMLVGAGAAMFVGLGQLLVLEFQSFGELLRFDPTRLVEAVVAGVSFLGAGSIFFARRNQSVQGLTTAASLWPTAGVGMAAGLGRYVLAIGSTLLVFVILHAFAWLDAKARKSDSDRKTS